MSSALRAAVGAAVRPGRIGKHLDWRRFAVLFALSSLVSSRQDIAADGPLHSALWGRNGEAWQQGGRLPDFSYAGYHRGERDLPGDGLVGTTSVRDFGAVGDGQSDDTAAFRRALEASAGKTVLVPPGRYLITDFVDIRTPGTVLRGAGRDETILSFPTPLNEIHPNWGATTTGQRTSNYSWSGGFVRIRGELRRKAIARIIEPAHRGARSLVVSETDGLGPREAVRLVQGDTPQNTLARHLYAGDPGSVENLRGRTSTAFVARITQIHAGTGRIDLDRALRTDVRLEWRPRLLPASSTVEESGIVDLGFEFPRTPYRGHFTELGFNAVALAGVRNCWVRRVRIRNADSGIFVSGENNTVEDVLIESEREIEPARKATGHHGITMGGQDNLLRRFEFTTRFMHGITVTHRSAGNVVAQGRGVDLSLDHHRYGPHANLFTDIDLGVGSRMFQSGGGAALGRHSGAHETFWCIRADRPQGWPVGWGPDLMNLVGVESDQPSVTSSDGRWFEVIDPDRLSPCNLYEAQLERRLGRLGSPSTGDDVR